MVQTILQIVTPLFKKRVVLANGMFLEALIATFFPGTKLITKVPGDIVWERARNQGKTTLDIDRFQGTETWRMKIFRFLFTACLKRSHNVIAPSEHLMSLIMRWGVSPERVVLIRNSTNSEFFKPLHPRKSEFDVISVGRLVKWKGFEELIEVCSSLGLKLLIVGDGPERQVLELLAKNLQASVKFTGEISHDSLPELLNKSRAFVLNSKYEGSPHSLIEALSTGCISIARASTGSSEVLRHGVEGFLYSDRQGLVDVLLKINKKPDGFGNIRRSGRELVLKNYSRDTNFQKILDLLMIDTNK
jgi:glycosyltransferase involved in cell wall biosynthesis